MLGKGRRALKNANGSECDRSCWDKAHRWHDSMETRWHRLRESVFSCLLVCSDCSSSGQGLTHVKGCISTLELLQGWLMESRESFGSLQVS